MQRKGGNVERDIVESNSAEASENVWRGIVELNSEAVVSRVIEDRRYVGRVSEDSRCVSRVSK